MPLFISVYPESCSTRAPCIQINAPFPLALPRKKTDIVKIANEIEEVRIHKRGRQPLPSSISPCVPASHRLISLVLLASRLHVSFMFHKGDNEYDIHDRDQVPAISSQETEVSTE